MNRTFTTIVILLLLATTTAQAQIYDKGINVLSAGFGFGSALVMGTTTKTPMFSLQYERGLVDINGSGFISLGCYGAYNLYSLGADKFSYTILGLRTAYHLNSVNLGNVDVYGGMMVSYDFRGAPSQGFRKRYLGLSGADLYHSKFDFMPFIGARFLLNDNMSVFTEASYGVSFISLGFAYFL
jgi:hypothetical protein